MATQNLSRANRKTRIFNKIKNVILDPFNLITLFAFIILIIFVVIPLLSVLKTTLTIAKADMKRAGLTEVGQFTLYYWKYVLASNMSQAVLWKPLLHSVIISVCTTVIGVPLGCIFSWLMIRSDLPGKKILSSLIIIPYMVPSWCKSMSWLALFRNERLGALGLLSGAGIHVPDWLAYGPVAITAVLVLHYYAFTYLMVAGALRSINSELEEMGEIQGASKPMILRKITMPLVLPAILSAAIMTFSKSLGGYGVAAYLGNPIGYTTMAIRMHEFTTSSIKGVGYVLAILMVLLASGCIYANQALIGTRKSYATIGGKGTRSNVMKLGKAKWPLFTFLVIFLIVALFIPMFVLFMESFQKTTGGGYGLDNLTLFNWVGRLSSEEAIRNYPGIFHNKEFLSSLKNTVLLTVVASVITAFLGQMFGYISSRGRGRWFGSIIDQLVFIPYLIPGIAFGGIFLAVFSKKILFFPSLYGTFALLVLVSVVKNFPFASRSGTATMMQISTELEEAAEIQGVGFWRRMARIVIPLSKNGFFSGLMLVFIAIAKELDLIAVCMTPTTRTLSYLSYIYSSDGLPQMADAISVVILVFVLVSYLIAGKVFHADISKSMG